MKYPKETLKIEGLDPKELAKYIDHTILMPDTTQKTIKQFCKEAKEHKFAGVCFNPIHIPLAAKELKGTGLAVATVIGFPLGATTPAVKAFEAKEAVDNGATELDMVINIGAVKDGDFDLVEKDIRGVVEAAHGEALVKVIIETCLLSDDEKVRVCKIAQKAGAEFVKTSSGFSTGGATKEDVALMKNTVGESMGVKASTGVRSAEAVVTMVNAGARRIGTGRGVAIISEPKV
jgi:deoxyribose-phosphate aldolase